MLRNSASLLEWNTDKRYLLDLPDTVQVVPSHVINSPSHTVIEDALDKLKWNAGVVKPAVGLDGHGVARIKRGEVGDEPRRGVWLLQPFIEEARTEGETSVIMIDGRPTHAVRRRPPAHDFRAQERLGGSVVACDAPDDILQLASVVVDWVQPRPLYARVDVVRWGGTPCLMELELVEPSLFLEHCPAALEAMAGTVQQLIFGNGVG